MALGWLYLGHKRGRGVQKRRDSRELRALRERLLTTRSGYRLSLTSPKPGWKSLLIVNPDGIPVVLISLKDQEWDQLTKAGKTKTTAHTEKR